ncbi:MAG: hypothetical protein V9G18_21870 [Albidovulum sp.]
MTDRMVRLPGIKETETLIAFRAYARKDIEAGFSLGRAIDPSIIDDR